MSCVVVNTQQFHVLKSIKLSLAVRSVKQQELTTTPQIEASRQQVPPLSNTSYIKLLSLLLY